MKCNIIPNGKSVHTNTGIQMLP